MRSLARILPLLIALGAMFAACTESSTTPPSSSAVTPPSSPTAGSTATPSATESTPSFYPQGTLTGVTRIDELLKAVYASDTKAFLAQIHWIEVGCDAPKDTVFPDCPSGAPDGTPVLSSVFGKCERGWVPKTVIEGNQNSLTYYFDEPLDVYAVAKLGPPDRPITQGGDPPAEYLIVVGVPGKADGLARAFAVDSEGAIESYLGCGRNAEQQLAMYREQGRVSGFLLPPKGK